MRAGWGQPGPPEERGGRRGDEVGQGGTMVLEGKSCSCPPYPPTSPTLAHAPTPHTPAQVQLPQPAPRLLQGLRQNLTARIAEQGVARQQQCGEGAVGMVEDSDGGGLQEEAGQVGGCSAAGGP